MKAEIITIGTELLLGEIVDTNSAYLTRQLRDIGVNIYYLTTVGDNTERIADAIRIALARSGVVITTGGLGPTVDDMTRQGVALATNRELEFRPDLFEQIRERFEQLGAQIGGNLVAEPQLLLDHDRLAAGRHFAGVAARQRNHLMLRGKRFS